MGNTLYSKKEMARYGYKTNVLHKVTGRYTIERVVMLQVEGHPQPRLYYVVLNGPRGGKVLCCPMNICDIVAHKYRVNLDTARDAIIYYGRKFNKIDMIYAGKWDVYNDQTGMRMVRHEDKYINQKLVGRVYAASDEIDLRNKIFNALYMEPGWAN